MHPRIGDSVRKRGRPYSLRLFLVASAWFFVVKHSATAFANPLVAVRFTVADQLAQRLVRTWMPWCPLDTSRCSGSGSSVEANRRTGLISRNARNSGIAVSEVSKAEHVEDDVSRSSIRSNDGCPVKFHSESGKRALQAIDASSARFDAVVNGELALLSKRPGEKHDLRRHIIRPPVDDEALAVSELIYLRVLRGFQSQLQVPMVGSLTTSLPIGAVDPRRLVQGKLYSPNMLGMIKDHLMGVIGEWDHLDRTFSLSIALFQLSDIYIQSALFGYYVRRVDQRYQLERLAGTFEGRRSELPLPPAEHANAAATDDLLSAAAASLESYVSNFGPEELLQNTEPPSREAQVALKQQVAALFGEGAASAGWHESWQDPKAWSLQQLIKTGTVSSGQLTVADLRRLVLEAVAFGTLLGDAERDVDSVYSLSFGTEGQLTESFTSTSTVNDLNAALV